MSRINPAVASSLPWIAAALCALAPHAEAQEGLKVHAASGQRTLLHTQWRHGDTDRDVDALTSAGLYARSRHVAARFTYASGEQREWQSFVEWSNAKTNAAMLPGAAFHVAFGANRRVADHLWLEMRVGERPRLDGNGREAAALVSLRLSPKALR